MTEVLVLARYTISAGQEAEVHALLPRLAAASRAEPGALEFVAYVSLEDPRDAVLLERYESREAFAAHRDTPHFHDLVEQQIIPRLDRRTVETYDVPG
jgi:quinol monooxygenase YgiN